MSLNVRLLSVHCLLRELIIDAAAVAESVKGGLEKAGGAAAIYQFAYLLPQKHSVVVNARIRVPETLSSEILTKMHAPAKPDYPIITPAKLTEFDAFIFGIPTRYGNFPAQWKVCMRTICQSHPLTYYFTSHSGMPRVPCGLLGHLQENTLGCLCPLVRKVEDKNPRPWLACLLLLTTGKLMLLSDYICAEHDALALSTFPSVMRPPSNN